MGVAKTCMENKDVRYRGGQTLDYKIKDLNRDPEAGSDSQWLKIQMSKISSSPIPY